MFLAIINDTYTEVKAELEAQKAERLVGDYFKKGYKNVINNVTGKGTVFENYLISLIIKAIVFCKLFKKTYLSQWSRILQ